MPAGRFLTDDLARALSLEPAAQRVVSLAPSCTESLLAIGAHGLERLTALLAA